MATFAALVVALGALVSSVSGTCVDDGGNWYCENVNAITYNNFGMSGSYDKVVDMDGCKTTKHAYSGSLAPLDGEVTVVFRGPIHLKQFAAYAPHTSNSGKHTKRSTDQHDHAHAHVNGKDHARFHDHNNPPQTPLDEVTEALANAFDLVKEKREVIVATWNNAVFSWTTTIGGAAKPTTAAKVDDAAIAKAPSVKQANRVPAAGGGIGGHTVPGFKPGTPGPGVNLPKTPVAAGDMARLAHYHAGSNKADGLVFLKQLYAPLSYCSKNGQEASSSPQILEDILVPSNHEFTIFTDQKCSGQNGDCGYFNPKIAGNAYHGFSGASKAFVFEFSMPHDHTTSTGLVPDTPAIWLLNSQITRTDQYSCSCWKSGCGEFDLFEVLAKGDKRMKSTYHSGQSLGSSDYFTRPTGGTIKAAVIMGDSSATIKILNDGFVFGEKLTKTQIQRIVGGAQTVMKLPN